ncbi:MAG TPA: hypothetical protein VN222_04425, partial [Novosphingobium sp.]|nr:hypothetical protein [Novosphingobium sp.]
MALAGAALIWPAGGGLRAQPAPDASPPVRLTQSASLPAGARWSAQVPAAWNGTLLLWSRGYAARPGEPELAPARARAALLGLGYAIAASDYGAGGWALEQAVPAQQATLRAFTQAYGRPRRVIAMGNSMGGLVTTALA